MWSTEDTCQLITAVVISFLMALIACKIFGMCICFEEYFTEGLFPIQGVRTTRTGNNNDIEYPYNLNFRTQFPT